MERQAELERGERVRRSGPVLASDVLSGEGLNQVLALWITARVGSMWAAYLFAALSLVSLPAVLASRNLIALVAWITQTFLQLVLLPVILVGQGVAAEHANARSEQDHALQVATHAKLDELLGRRRGRE